MLNGVAALTDKWLSEELTPGRRSLFSLKIKR